MDARDIYKHLVEIWCHEHGQVLVALEEKHEEVIKKVS